MTDANWAIGDLAICVADDWRCGRCGNATDCEAMPTKDRIYRVCGLSTDAAGYLMLHLEEIPEGRFEHSGFRKVQPDTQPAAEDLWVEQLQHLKRKEAA